jgi:hypothetical protein
LPFQGLNMVYFQTAELLLINPCEGNHFVRETGNSSDETIGTHLLFSGLTQVSCNFASGFCDPVGGGHFL